MRVSNKLTALAVTRRNNPGRYADGKGLYLQVTDAGDGNVTKAWLFRFMLNGRARQMGLGPVDLIKLADAREKRDDCRRQLREGIDPIEARRSVRVEARVEAAKSITFEDCAECGRTPLAGGALESNGTGAQTAAQPC